jgi:SAM-dependent methyltransferase
LIAARERGLNATGVDSAERSVRMATERGLDVRLGGIAELRREEAHYDAILVQSVLEHVDDGLELVIGLKERLADGGVLVLSAPTPGPYFWDDPTHVRPYTPKSFAILAELAGLRCEYNGYVFSFLLGIEARASIFFRLLNTVPFSLGSNLVAFLRADVTSGG